MALRVLYLARVETGRASWSVDVSGHPHEFLRGGAVTFRARKGPFAWKWNTGVSGALDAARPEVVIVSGLAHPAMHVAVSWARRNAVPWCVTSESHPRSHGPLRSRARRLVAGRVVRGAAAWLPVSSRAQELLVALGAKPERCRLVPNAPDAERFAAARRDGAARAATRESLGAGAEPVTLFVGRLIAAKGLSTLVEAARSLAPAVPTTWIAGDGPLRTRLAVRVAREGLGGRVRLLGERGYDEVVRLQAAADVSVLPSRHEPYGVALHEGMAAGCAGLASDAVGAAADLVVPGATGAVFPAGDAQAMARAWAALVADPRRLAAMGAAAQHRALERGLPFAVENLEAAVLEAVSARAPSPAGAP